MTNTLKGVKFTCGKYDSPLYQLCYFDLFYAHTTQKYTLHVFCMCSDKKSENR